MSFAKFLKLKKQPVVSVSFDHYKETLERDIYDTLLDPIHRENCFMENMSEIMGLNANLQALEYPKTNELLMAVASRDVGKIRKAHEQFSFWGKKNAAEEIPFVENALFECRSYLYGKEIAFSKDAANRLIESSMKETQKNVEKIAFLMEKAIGKVTNWHGSSVIFKVLKPQNNWISNEGLVIVGQPPSMTFMCANSEKLELYDIQDIEGYPISLQEDCMNLIRSLQHIKPPLAFKTMYFAARPKDRSKFEQIKRELALGVESVLPSNVELLEESPDMFDMDVWRVKIKDGVITEETPIRWIELHCKYEEI